MTFQPVVPLTGYVGWRFLERTVETQQNTFSASQPIARATEYFRENISGVTSAQDLVSDRQLLAVALGAFGLDDDINNIAFIRRVLDDGTVADDALANRLSDNRYTELSRSFGFGDLPFPLTGVTSFADDIIARFENQQFAKAVGAQNNDLRLALNVQTGLGDVLERNSSNTGQWFSVMGNAPLREVFQVALGLPDAIASVDVDRQREIFQERSVTVLGTDQLTDLADPAQQEKLIRLFLVRSEAGGIDTLSSSANALTLLQNSPRLFA